MNSENRPANSGSKNNRNRRKPYYMKKKPHNEGDEQKKISPGIPGEVLPSAEKKERNDATGSI